MTRSQELFTQAKKYIPGGVNSPVRAFNGVGGDPVFFQAAEGPYLIDADNKRYIDYVGSWGPMIAGHAHPHIVQAVTKAVENGLSFGAPTELEVTLAKKIIEFMPSIELIRMVNSGTEATMSAIRLARGYTKRNKIIKFAGCYHGHADSLLVSAGSGALTLGVPSSAGVPTDIAQHTLVAEFNRLDTVEALFKKWGNDVAAIIVEPIAGNMNFVPARADFLKGLRELCDQHHAVLIIDEVMTGFRVAPGGAQSLYNIKADLTTLGKIIGGGMPVGAFGGRKEIMHCIAPTGPVYQAGTLSGNPIAMTAGLATLELLSAPNFYLQLEKTTHKLIDGLNAVAKKHQIPFIAHAVCGMFGIYFTNHHDIETLADVKKCNLAHFQRFYHAMLEKGVYLAPSAFEAGFVSSAHGIEEIEKTLEAAEFAFKSLTAVA